MKHDKFCFYRRFPVWVGLGSRRCVCEKIREVREDERNATLDAAYKAAHDCTVAIREPGIYLLNRDLVLKTIDSLRNGGVHNREMGA